MVIELELYGSIKHDIIRILKFQTYKQWQITSVDKVLDYETSDYEFSSH